MIYLTGDTHAVFDRIDDFCRERRTTREDILIILGDAGINAKVPANFWEGIKIRMVEQFKQGLITEGIREAVLSAGNALKTYFPYQTDDKNELPDDISFN